MQIQSSITPHLEVLHKGKVYVETVLKKYPNLSTLDGLVHLAVEISIQHKTLDIALKKLHTTLKILLEVNSTFLAKHGIVPQDPLTLVSKRGRYTNGEKYTKGEIYTYMGECQIYHFLLHSFIHFLKIKWKVCKQPKEGGK